MTDATKLLSQEWDAVWVASQERCSAVEGKSRLQQIDQQLGALVERLTPAVCEQCIRPGDTEFEHYLQRLRACASYHWRRLATTRLTHFREVMGHLEPTREVPPIRNHLAAEVLLAQALQHGQAQAAEAFETEYMPMARAIARRAGGERALETVENFAAELVLPRPGSPPRIATFRGSTTLSHWLVPVVANFCRTQLRRKPPVSLSLISEPATDDVAVAGGEEPCEEMLRPIFSEAVQTLSAEDRLLLQLLVLDGVPQKQLARSMQLNSGTLTRRRQRASGMVLERIRHQVQTSPLLGKLADCLQILLAGEDPELRSRLACILAEGVRISRCPGPEESRA